MSSSSAADACGSPVYWVCAALLGCGVVLAANPLPFRSPVPEAVHVPASATDATPVRKPKMQPVYAVSVYMYRCSECHAIISERGAETLREGTQHREIELHHGINTSCFNCHHQTNRDAFAGEDGKELPWSQPQLLCAKCHGPVYRDWQHGSHGRSNGYWDTSQGVQTRRRCIECHDPHQPPFPDLHPAPPPRTLRMGPTGATSHAATPNPLRLERSATGLPHDNGEP